jgi:hypothetical protein
MKKTKKEPKTVKKSYRSRRTIAAFWICLVLVLLPFAILGWVLFSAARDTHTPVLGNRYEGDLDPAITSSQIEEIDTNVAAADGVESEFSNLATGTLRVYAKIADDATADTATATAQNIYTIVSQTLDPTVYFAQADGKKMYDLEIHVYNYSADQDSTADTFVYVIGTKTSSMTDPLYETVSTAKSPELAAQLEQDVIDRQAAEAAASASPTATAAAQ